MLQLLKEWDKTLFLAINGCHSTWADWLMLQCSGNLIWIPFYLLLIYTLYQKLDIKKMVVALVFVAICVALADQSSVHLFKNVIQRYRPCYNLEIQNSIHLVKHCGGLYGFVSSHAANTFSVAIFLGTLLNKKWVWYSVVIWTILVGYSRIYLGVHYPLDIFCGGILGAAIGTVVFFGYQRVSTKLKMNA